MFFRSLQGRSSSFALVCFLGENSSNISQIHEPVNNFFIFFQAVHQMKSVKIICCCAALFQRRIKYYHMKNALASTFLIIFYFHTLRTLIRICLITVCFQVKFYHLNLSSQMLYPIKPPCCIFSICFEIWSCSSSAMELAPLFRSLSPVS